MQVLVCRSSSPKCRHITGAKITRSSGVSSCREDQLSPYSTQRLEQRILCLLTSCYKRILIIIGMSIATCRNRCAAFPAALNRTGETVAHTAA